MSFVQLGKVGEVYVFINYNADPGDADLVANITIRNATKGRTIFDEVADRGASTSYDPQDGQLFVVSETAENGETLAKDDIEVDVEVLGIDSNGEVRVNMGNTLETSHQHEVRPGVIEQFPDSERFARQIYYPSDCDVTVNGTTLDTDLGDGNGPFRREVDLLAAAESPNNSFNGLKEGEINRIEVSSTSVGHLTLLVDGDVYRQISGGG